MARRSAAPPYARVKAWLKEGLLARRWPSDRAMPSEAELMARFGVSRMTAGRAVRELAAEGLVVRRQGAGTFAAPLERVAATLSIRDLHADLEAGGHRHATDVKLARVERAGAEVALRLGRPRGARVYHTILVHRRDGVPVLCEDRFVHPQAAPEYLDVDFTHTTPTRYLLEVAPFREAQYSIVAGRPTSREARWLEIPADEACLILQRETRDARRTITCARLVHPGTRTALQGQFSP